jgi:glycosyltransferase involved in cell wall biosynthesis
MKKRVFISVTSDLVTDQRVRRAATALNEAGYEVVVVGRQLKKSSALAEKGYQIVRFRLWFERGFLFYMTFNLRLFFFLLFKKVDILLSNDLDTLLPNYLISKIKFIPLVYDSHEYFTEVPEIQHRPFVKTTWQTIEKLIVPKLKYAYTVNNSIAKLYFDKYQIHFDVIRNVPIKIPVGTFSKEELRKELQLPKDSFIVILQGAGINIDRGAEEAVQSMKYVQDVLLLIVGDGDVVSALKQTVKDEKLEDKVHFYPKQALHELMRYTHAADLGLTLDKDTNLNYKFSLPNKIFDYIQAGIPILASNLPEIKNIIETYQIGEIILDHTPATIAKAVEEIKINSFQVTTWRNNLQRAQQELNWSHEKEKLIALFHKVES